MKTIKGPSLHLAQFSDAAPPFNSLPAIAAWAKETGFKALQIPAWDSRLFDVKTAAESQSYCDDITGMLAQHGLVISELTTHIFGQLMAVHPAYDALCDSFVPEGLRGDPQGRTLWAKENLLLAAKASARLGLTEMGTFSGSLAWPYLFPFPQRPAGLIETAFDELAKRWLPVLDACDEQGINLCYEIHPAKICMMALPLKCSISALRLIHAAKCCSIPAISCCNSSTIWNLLISIKITSACFTLRMQSSIQVVGRGFTVAISPGRIVQGVSVH